MTTRYDDLAARAGGGADLGGGVRVNVPPKQRKALEKEMRTLASEYPGGAAAFEAARKRLLKRAEYETERSRRALPTVTPVVRGGVRRRDRDAASSSSRTKRQERDGASSLPTGCFVGGEESRS